MPAGGADRSYMRLPNERVVLLAVGAAGLLDAAAVTPTRRVPAARARAARGVHPARAAVPWGVGERFTYDVRYGVLRVGSGAMEVQDVADVRDRHAYHTVLRISGGILGYKIDDTFESWFDAETLASLRFHQTQLEGGKSRNKRYEIFPERQTYRDGDQPEARSVADPLDDGSFLYFVRTLPLHTGDAYAFDRYFKPDHNPVRIRVLRRERVRVPAGTFAAVVLQPVLRTKGLFSEGGRAEVWVSDDSARVLLQVKTSVSVGTLTMQLRSRNAGHS